MLDSPVHLAAIFLLLESLSLVKLLFTLAQGNVHLRPTLFVDEDEQGDDGITRLLGGTLQFLYLLLGEQQLPVALHLVVVV